MKIGQYLATKGCGLLFLAHLVCRPILSIPISFVEVRDQYKR